MAKMQSGLSIVTIMVLGLLTGCGEKDQTDGTVRASLQSHDIYTQSEKDSTEQFYLEGNGIYLGQIDPHSIEISMDGTPTAFQLAEEAVTQLSTIHSGMEIGFLYTDTGKGQKTIEKFNTISGMITLNQSLLQVDQELADLVNKLQETKDKDVIKDIDAFGIFTMYMYTKAGQDFETLYYFHELDSNSIRVDEFKKENMTADAISQNDSFMRMLDQVREFEVRETADNRAIISFKLPDEERVYEFKLFKTTRGWQVMWVPFQ